MDEDLLEDKLYQTKYQFNEWKFTPVKFYGRVNNLIDGTTK